MMRIEKSAWDTMVEHVARSYPQEGCGALLGAIEDGEKRVRVAVPLENAFAGARRTRYEVRPEDLLRAQSAARDRGMDLVGIFHSHPDCDAYFSQTDLRNSCPWYAFVVLSIRRGKFDHAACWLPNAEQSAATREELVVIGDCTHPCG